MDIVITPGKLSGKIDAIPSKSQAHRLLICAAFSSKNITLICPETSQDIEATVDCLCSLGAKIQKIPCGYHVQPITNVPQEAILNCRESGSTLRFLLPIVGALGIKAQFQMEGRLPHRPLSPLWEEMERMGCHLSRPADNTILCQGKLKSGEYTIAGNVSSQFVSGLLFALELLGSPSSLKITGCLESAPYVKMTEAALNLFHSGNNIPDTIIVEGDWSNGAFWLAARALGCELAVGNLDANSIQGDRVATCLLSGLERHCTISAENIPDLVPVLSVVAAANQGAVFTGIQRLRLKESDRVATTIAMVENLGGKAEATDETLIIYGTGLSGGTVDSFQDHRIAMSAAIASTICQETVTILGAECISKSYPRFWQDFRRLGGNYYEQHIR